MNRFGMALAFIMLTLGLVLVMINPQAVSLNFYFAHATVSLGFALLVTLAFGIALAALLSGWLVMRYRMKLTHLQRQYKLIYQEVRNLRRMPLHEA